MLEMGVRFTNDLYLMVAFDPSDGTCTVTVETDEGTVEGSVTWDEDLEG